jgi:tRNA threonylcarbamoyladenosine biosynthesis protein TsaE
VADTQAFGARLAAVLRVGDVVILNGPLGAGKTALTQGIGRGLDVVGPIASPTFVIARVHPARTPGRAGLVHVDAYRLGSVAEVDDLDLDEELDRSVLVVEWGHGLVEQLTDAWLEVELRRADDSDSRAARVVAHGGDWAERWAGRSAP